MGQLAAASAGDEGAIVYTESDEADNNGVVRNLVVLQRLDAMGAASGPPVELDIVESKGYGLPALTVATDGSRYLACWEREGSIVCAGVPVGEGSALSVLTFVIVMSVSFIYIRFVGGNIRALAEEG